MIDKTSLSRFLSCDSICLPKKSFRGHPAILEESIDF